MTFRTHRDRLRISRLMVVGCGLIGGSIALAARRHIPDLEVCGIDRPRVLEVARTMGTIDRAFSPSQLSRALRVVSPDVLVLATGVDDILARIPAVASMLGQLDPALRPLVLDVGSVKTAVVAAAEDSACPRFIGGHPMAGRERSGLQHACASLFEDRPFVLCPSIGSSRADLLAARRFVRAMGARPLPMSAALHDRCVALVSHVPHLLAVSLMEAGRRLERELGSGLPWKLAAGAWRDATRVAMADPHLWAPIFVHNKAAIVQALDLWLQVVSQLRAALQAPAGKRVKALDAAGLARLRHRIERHLPPQS